MMRSKSLHIGLQFFASNRLCEIEARLSAIRTEMEADGADLDALEQEVNDLTEERTRLTDAAERRGSFVRKVLRMADLQKSVCEPVGKHRKDLLSVLDDFKCIGDMARNRGSAVPQPAENSA